MSEAPARARKQADKQRRRDALLRAAAELFAERRFAEIKMAEIAAAAGVAKGTVFLYFPTKEALFLELLASELEAWLSELDVGLERGRGPWSSARVARLVTETLLPRTTLTRLLALLASVLEHNVDVEQIAGFKLALRDRLGRTGALLERRLEFLAAGEGAHLMLQIYALVIGVHQTANPGPAARAALTRPELASLVVEFEAELETMLRALLRGLESI